MTFLKDYVFRIKGWSGRASMTIKDTLNVSFGQEKGYTRPYLLHKGCK